MTMQTLSMLEGLFEVMFDTGLVLLGAGAALLIEDAVRRDEEARQEKEREAKGVRLAIGRRMRWAAKHRLMETLGKVPEDARGAVENWEPRRTERGSAL